MDPGPDVSDAVPVHVPVRFSCAGCCELGMVGESQPARARSVQTTIGFAATRPISIGFEKSNASARALDRLCLGCESRSKEFSHGLPEIR